MRQMKNTALHLLTTLSLLGSFPPARISAQIDTPVRIGQGIDPPRKTVHVPPVYPAVAQAARVQGVVILEATIGRQGRVINARVLRSIPLLDQAAIDAVRQWQFVPTSLKGVPVPVLMTVTVNFTLTIGSERSSAPPIPTIASPYPVAERKLQASLQPMLDQLTNVSSSGPSSTAAKSPCPGPSYDVSPLRWQTFPLSVYIEEPELARRGYSPDRTSQIVQLIMKGLGSWADATGQRVGAIQRVTDHTKSQLNVVFRNGTGNTVHDSVQSNIVRHATILMDIMRDESFGAPFEQTYEGRSFTDGADHRIVNTAAHEMGHVLGIVQHPGSSGSLMVGSPEQLFYEGPQPIDVNSILKKYGACASGASLGPPTPSPPAPAPVAQPPVIPVASVPFAGRWQCTVYGSEALMNQFSFIVSDDGTVFLAGLAEEPRAAITPSSLQFESRGGGTVDATSLRGNSSRLDGTRTLTIPGIPTVSHRISCVPNQRR